MNQVPERPATDQEQDWGADERTAAEASDKARLLVLERYDVHRQFRCRVIRRERSRNLERIDDAERSIQPAACGLRIGVRTDEQRLSWLP